MNRSFLLVLAGFLLAACTSPSASVNDAMLTEEVTDLLLGVHAKGEASSADATGWDPFDRFNEAAEAETKATAEMGRLRHRVGAKTLRRAIKSAVNAKRFLIWGRAMGVAQNYLSPDEFHDLTKAGEEDCNTVQRALYCGYPKRALAMMQENPELIESRDAENKETPLHIAADRENVDLVQWLLQHGADPNAKAYSDFTPLHLTENGEIARMLICGGANLDQRDSWGNTPLQKAAQLGHKAVIDAIIESGHPIDLRSALWLKKRDRVKEILRQNPRIPPEDENREDLWGDTTPLGIAASQGDIEIVRLLLAAGANANATTYLPNHSANLSPLVMAAVGGHTEIVKLLCEKGANCNIIIEQRWDKLSLLDWAEKHGKPAIVKILKSYGAKRYEQIDRDEGAPCR
ncbi:MAG TPA: ankyrin repeat domain-containing protein [Planctomycetota bacterium]|nr:ankyrin repeat domain-containing protein [Planctomycetota bacterium]